jgi:DNA-binding transcriptional regulator WhiA
MKREIILPAEKSIELAELMGILFGDGYVNYYPKSKDYVIDIAGNSLTDLEYHRSFIKSLFKQLFNVEPKIYFSKKRNSLSSRVSSKEILGFVVSVGMPIGKKTNLVIPGWIKDNDSYFTAFIRGVFDTDGSFILRKRGQNSLSLVLKSERVILDIKTFLQKYAYFIAYSRSQVHDLRGFYSITHCIRINQKQMITRFYREIGSSNPYKSEKFELEKWARRDLNTRHHGLQPCALPV